MTKGNATGNDHVMVRLYDTRRNTTTSKLATCQVLLDISIPKDTSNLTKTVQGDLVSCLASLLNESAVLAATRANINALLGGADL